MRQPTALSAVLDRTFGSLRRHRNYRLYFIGNGISFIGTWMQQIAAYWLILQLTNSPVAVGVLALVQTLPITVLALVGGAIADRVDLRRMIVTCESALACIAAILAVLALTGTIEAWQIYVLGFAQGVAIALDAPARHTLVFQIVGRKDLTNAVALSFGITRYRAPVSVRVKRLLDDGARLFDERADVARDLVRQQIGGPDEAAGVIVAVHDQLAHDHTVPEGDDPGVAVEAGVDHEPRHQARV